METRKFEFTNYNVEVGISEHKFILDCSSETGDYIQHASVEFKQLSDELRTGSKTVGDAVEYCTTFIEHLIGKGAVNEIFSNRKIRLSDLIDICMFLIETANEFSRGRHKTNANRTQRRADNGKRKK